MSTVASPTKTGSDSAVANRSPKPHPHLKPRRIRSRNDVANGKNGANAGGQDQGQHLESVRKKRKMDDDGDLELEFRTEEPGYWTVALLPLAIYFADQPYLSPTFPAVMLLIYNAVLISVFRYCGGAENLRWYFNRMIKVNFLLAVAGVAFFSIVSAARSPLGIHILYENILLMGLTFSFPYVFINLNLHYPRSFSFGEGMIVTSAFMYSLWCAFHNILASNFSGIQNAADPIILTIFQENLFLLTIIVCRVIVLFMKPDYIFPLQEIYSLCAKAAFAVFIGKLENTGDDIQFLVLWFFNYLFGDCRHLIFLTFWAILCAATVAFVIYSVGQATTTMDRKFFHLLICCVYFPVILNDLNFIFFCSSFVLYCFIVVEVCRVLDFEVAEVRIGEFIDKGISNFRDDRDSGPLLLTPIYLLAGCSAPIWLTGLHFNNTTTTNMDRTPEELAAAITGILSVGVGDSVASLVGSVYGELHWPRSKKTIEGTIASIVAQLVTVFVLCWTGYLPYTTVSVIALCICCFVNAVVEAFTTHIDNLIIPLVAFNTVHLVVYFSDFLVS